MIEQQYYTRERGGLFSPTDGYDTVAKSPQLKLDYIKKNLHPLCSYDIPIELQRTGEQEESKYPPSMVVMPGPSGEFIIGQAVYKAKDFTGLRSTFFMHNFVLSENEKYRYIKDPEKIFGITDFKSHFNIAEGRQLPTLAALSYNGNNPYFIERERLFSKLKMSQEVFHKLVYATFVAAHSKKKIFIVLNVGIEELGEMAKALLYHLYTVLPWKVTETLGVCTYSNKVEAKKNIHITFLDKETLHYDTKLGKDFIFDFVNQKFLNIEGEIEGEPYIKIGIGYAKNRVAWEKINRWAEVLATTLKNKEEQDIKFFGKIVMLFELSLCIKVGKAYDFANLKTRKELMKQILAYLQCNIADDIRKELFEMMEYIIQGLHEEIGQGKLIEEDEIESLLKFKVEYCRNREQEAHCIQILLHLLTVATRERNESYIHLLLAKVHLHQKTYIHLFEVMYQSDDLRKQVIYYLIRESCKEVTKLQDLIEQMAKFEEVEELLLKDRYYAQVIYEKFGTCLLSIKDPLAFLNQLQQWCSKHQNDIYSNLQEQGEYYFLEHIKLKDIPNDQILCNLSFNRRYPLETYDIIQDYQKLKSDISYMTPSKIRVNSKVQELVKLFYKQKPRKDEFYMLVYAFLEMDGATHQLKLNLKRVLMYLHSIHIKVMLDFIIWAKGQEMYIDKKRFDAEVINIFIGLKQKGKKIDKELIKSKLGGQAKTKALCEKILSALKPSVVKWIGRNGKLVGGVFILSIIGVGAGVGFYQQQDKKVSQNQSVHQKIELKSLDQETINKLIPNVIINHQEIEAFAKQYIDLEDEFRQGNDIDNTNKDLNKDEILNAQETLDEEGLGEE